VPYYEKLITKAKKGDLHNRRLVISKLATVESAHKLVDEIAPKLSST
jgi:large subunit ribosomal protein L17